MNRKLCLILSVCTLTWTGVTGFGQEISINRRGDTQVWVRASAPLNTRYALQVSQDLQLWLDLNDSVSGTVSNQVGQAAAGQRYFRLAPWTEPAPITVVLLGDSTVADKAANLNYFDGWGQGIYPYFKPAARIVNLASPALGTKNFFGSDEMARMLAIKPQYVLVELCYVDAFSPPEVATTLPEYEDNLRKIVQMIRDFGGVPILLTPQAVWIFNDQDQTGAPYPERNAIISKVGQDMQVDVIDLSSTSVDLLNRLGKTGSDDLFVDWLHFTDLGADTIAGLVVRALPPVFGPYLVTEKTLPY